MTDSFQWSTWVGATLVVLAEIIQRYHRLWETWLIRMLPEPCRRFIADLSRDKNNPQQKSRREDEDDHDGTVEDSSQSEPGSRQRLRDEWADFKMWWNDPIQQSPLNEHSYSPSSDDSSSRKEPASKRPSWSNSSMQSPEPSKYRGFDSMSTPLLPINTRPPPPQPEPYDPGLSEEAVHDQGTIHRSTFERQNSTFSSSY